MNKDNLVVNLLRVLESQDRHWPIDEDDIGGCIICKAVYDLREYTKYHVREQPTKKTPKKARK